MTWPCQDCWRRTGTEGWWISHIDSTPGRYPRGDVAWLCLDCLSAPTPADQGAGRP